jgi:tetratricopeptide (TPR) repeat protein
LQAEAASLPKDIKVEIWHDSLGWLRKRSPIGVVATEAQAADLAKRINAHMVIYGTLDVNQDPATFTPKFYAATVRSETAEIIGGQQLGAPVAFRSPVDFNDTRTGAYFDKNLKPRAEALVWFTWGLALDLTGQNDKALQVFREAEPQFKTWSKDQGNEILYVFMGREAMFLARNETEAKKAFNSASEAIDFAEGAFSKALNSNSSYDRAYLWMGNVYSERAQRMLAAGQLDQDNLSQVRADLDRATTQYQTALQYAEAINSVVGVRTQLSLGTVDYLKAATFLLTKDNALADPLYQSAIDQIQKTLPLVDKDQHRVLAQTYQILGAAYFSQGYANPDNRDKSNQLWDRALFYFDQCLLQANRDTYDEFLQDFKDKYCSEGIKEVGKAKEQRNSGG